MSNYKYFNTGMSGKNTVQAFMDYDKREKAYCAKFLVGDNKGGLFGWHIDGDYFTYYSKVGTAILVPSGRRNAKKEAEAAAMFEANAEEYAREFAERVAAIGGPKMNITAA